MGGGGRGPWARPERPDHGLGTLWKTQIWIGPALGPAHAPLPHGRCPMTPGPMVPGTRGLLYGGPIIHIIFIVALLSLLYPYSPGVALCCMLYFVQLRRTACEGRRRGPTISVDRRRRHSGQEPTPEDDRETATPKDRRKNNWPNMFPHKQKEEQNKHGKQRHTHTHTHIRNNQ